MVIRSGLARLRVQRRLQRELDQPSDTQHVHADGPRGDADVDVHADGPHADVRADGPHADADAVADGDGDVDVDAAHGVGAEASSDASPPGAYVVYGGAGRGSRPGAESEEWGWGCPPGGPSTRCAVPLPPLFDSRFRGYGKNKVSE